MAEPASALENGFAFEGYEQLSWGWFREKSYHGWWSWILYHSGHGDQGWPVGEFTLHPDADTILAEFSLWRLTR